MASDQEVVVEAVEFAVRIGGKFKGYVMRDYGADLGGETRYFPVVIRPDRTPHVLPAITGRRSAECRIQAVAALLDYAD